MLKKYRVLVIITPPRLRVTPVPVLVFATSAFSSVSQLEEGEINRDAFTRELDYKGP